MISEEKAYEAACQMYAREHDRWNQWALFYFGIIAAAFVAQQQAGDRIPGWLPSVVGFVMSILWILTAASIRASTQSWREILQEIESPPAPLPAIPATTPFRAFDEHFKNKRCRFRVTALLIAVGVISAALFGYLGFVEIYSAYRARPIPVNASQPEPNTSATP